jgi:signal transduction histidine kinase
VNLCLNAIQAMPDGGTLCVATRAWAWDGRPGVELAVRDTGPGVAEAVRRQLFEPFITTKPEGSGLGLAVSRSIIEQHRGRIWLGEQAAEGTAFHVWLPESGGGTQPAPAA